MSNKKKKNRLNQTQPSKEFSHYFSPKTEKQKEFVNLINSKEIVICTGVAGSGKTITALATALSLLKQGYKKIILVKSVTTIPGEDIGFIPGGFEEKMEPFILSYIGNVNKLLECGSSKTLLDNGIMEVLPLAYIRGLSIDDSVVIVDESQNLTTHTFKTIITRIGENSKYIFLGDTEQIDRQKSKESSLRTVYDIFEDSDLIGTVNFEDSDCVRNPVIPKILEKLREHNI